MLKARERGEERKEKKVHATGKDCENRTMVAAYLRVSSSGQSVASQRAAIRAWASSRRVRVARWFEERVSARTLGRPVLTQIRGAAARGELRKLIVFRLDRLNRSGILETFGLLEELRQAGCEVVSVADGFTFDRSPMGQLATAVVALCAELEREAIGQRVAAARARVRARGGKWGRPRRAGAELERRALELAGKGKSVRQIAIALKLKRSTVQDTLGRARAAAGKASGKPPAARARRRPGFSRARAA